MARRRNRTGARLAVGFNNFGRAQRKLGHAAAAEPSFRHALALQETLVKQDPQDVDLQSKLGVMYNDLGIVLEELNRAADAVKAYEQAVAHQQQAMARPRRLPGIESFSASTTSTTAGHCGRRGTPATPPGLPWHDATCGPTIRNTCSPSPRNSP